MKKIPTLKKRHEFVSLSSKGTKIVTKAIVVQALKRADSDDAGMRVGYTVTRKVGNAVIRNRIKRRLREAAKEVLSNLGKSNYDYVLIGRKATLERDYIALLKDLKYALHQL